MYINISGLVSSLVRVLRGVLVKKDVAKRGRKKKEIGKQIQNVWLSDG